jgi:hypothetical protein
LTESLAELRIRLLDARFHAVANGVRSACDGALRSIERRRWRRGSRTAVADRWAKLSGLVAVAATQLILTACPRIVVRQERRLLNRCGNTRRLPADHQTYNSHGERNRRWSHSHDPLR